ncbi:hypothetical protein B0H19DRAFT_1077893 [Mycena capillaripes]|nr:hypothetical protein B0H19DRAFT_1077893 [Mycena capillaripes]
MDPSSRKQDTSFTPTDLAYNKGNLDIGGCLIAVHEPAEAAFWIENNCDSSLLTSMRNNGCAGPFAWMLSPAEPALAIFGWNNVPVVAQSLAEASGFHVVVRPPGDNPALTLLCRNLFALLLVLRDMHRARTVHPADVPDQSGDAPSSSRERSNRNDATNEDARMSSASRDGGRRRDDDLDNPGSTGSGLNKVDEHKRHRCDSGEHGDGGGDGGGGGPTSVGSKWGSPLHRTRIKLRLKLTSGHAYAVTIGYTFKFTINRETEIPIDLADLTRPLSQPEVMAFVDFKIETRPRETQVDRSYASIGFVVHRPKSIIDRECLHRGFELPSRLYTCGQHRQVQREFKAALGISQGSPLAIASFSHNRNNDITLEATDNKVMPRCRVDYETGDEWNKDTKSYSSYNIAYQLQVIRLDAERSEFHPLEVTVGMGMNLCPAASRLILLTSFPPYHLPTQGYRKTSSTDISYLDNIQTEEKLAINEEEDIELTEEPPEPGTIFLSIAQVQYPGAFGSNKFGAGFISKLGQQSSATPPFDIPPHEYLARGWDVDNNEWRSVLWPALDKHSRAALYKRTSPVFNIECPLKQGQNTISREEETGNPRSVWTL